MRTVTCTFVHSSFVSKEAWIENWNEESPGMNAFWLRHQKETCWIMKFISLCGQRRQSWELTSWRHNICCSFVFSRSWLWDKGSNPSPLFGQWSNSKKGVEKSCKEGKANNRDCVINSATHVGNWGLVCRANCKKLKYLLYLWKGSWDIKRKLSSNSCLSWRLRL